MSKAVIFFCICVSIIFGVVSRVFDVSLVLSISIISFLYFVSVFIGIIINNNKFYFGIVLLIPFLVGHLYTGLLINDDNNSVEYNKEIIISGYVNSYPKISEFGKSFLLDTKFGNLQIYVPFSQNVEYGDGFVINGEISKLSENQQYLKRYYVFGVVKDPKVINYAKGDFSVKRFLYGIRTNIRNTFVKIFPYDEASLAIGVLIGGGSITFSDNIKRYMQNSGTTHIVALSGYNISIIVVWIYGMCGFLFKRKKTFFVTCFVVLFFTIMTGAESSIVRAAVMGVLVILSQHIGRVYNFRQSTVAVLCLMLILSPYAIRYDIGFILSFLSLFGIVYISPLILYKFRNVSSIFSGIVKIGSQTIGAQLMVLPIVMIAFGGFSVLGVVANVFILPIVPMSMVFSFLIGILGIVSIDIAYVFSLIARPIFEYIIFVLHIFGSIEKVNFSNSIIFPIVYYSFVILVIFYAYKKKVFQNNCF